MLFEPYRYQKEAISFIKDHHSTALLLDMGLGKTVITLTAFSELKREGKVEKLLVVAPKRVAEITWPAEIEFWDHLKELRVSVIKGDAKKRKAACLQDADVYLLGRDSVSWLVKERCCPKCDMLAIDEMQSFKNAKSERTKGMIKLRYNFKRAVGLSGTPAPNGWLDLWAQYRIVDGGNAFGTSYWGFLQEHFMPSKTIRCKGKDRVIAYAPKPGHEEFLEDKIAPITMSLKQMKVKADAKANNEEVHLDLPGIRFAKTYCEMTNSEMNEYQSFAALNEGYVGGEHFKVPTDEALVAKLVQLASGTAYDAEGNPVQIHSHKLEALLEFIEEAEGKPMLVAYWFRGDFERITNALEDAKIKYMDIASQDAVDKWNAKKLQVGLIHPAKAGHGLNLQTGGATLVWYTMPWNYELYAQTNARLHRNGQTECVLINHIMTRNTIDDAIFGVLLRKRKLQEKLFQDLDGKERSGETEVTRQLSLFDGVEKQRIANTQTAVGAFYYKPYDPKVDVLPPIVAWN